MEKETFLSSKYKLSDWVINRKRGPLAFLLNTYFKGIPRKIEMISQVLGGECFYHVRFSNGKTLGLKESDIRLARRNELKRVGIFPEHKLRNWLRFQVVQWKNRPLRKSGLCIGDYVLPRDKYFANLNQYFAGKPQKVVGLEKGSRDAGWVFVYTNGPGGRQGYYLSALRKATDKEVAQLNE